MLTWIARPITAHPLSLLPAQHSDRTFRDYRLKWLPVAQQNTSRENLTFDVGLARHSSLTGSKTRSRFENMRHRNPSRRQKGVFLDPLSILLPVAPDQVYASYP